MPPPNASGVVWFFSRFIFIFIFSCFINTELLLYLGTFDLFKGPRVGNDGENGPKQRQSPDVSFGFNLVKGGMA